MPVPLLAIAQAAPLAGAQRLMLLNVLVLLLILAFAVGVALALVRRSVHERVGAARLAAMGTATARILHQVKNPLQTILLHAEMLQDERMAADPAVRREVSEAMVGEAKRMSALLAELSAYAAGVGRRLHLEPLALHELVGAAVRQVAREAEREGVRVATSRLEELVVPADPYFLRQAVENVLRNACEALREPTARSDGRIEVSLRRRGDEAVVEVRDDGPGIAADRMPGVFEPFVTSKGRGMGLGLPICREIVEGHGGRVELRSRPGFGTAVSLCLPLRPVRAPTLQPA